MSRKIFVLGTVGAIVTALIGGILGSGVFDGVTGSGFPNPGSTIGAVVGAVAGGYLTSKSLRRRQEGATGNDNGPREKP